MTLTTRLLLFFLATLTLVLAGFSLTLFLLAKIYLERQTEERLDAALNALVAAVEVGPDSVEWEPDQRHKSFGPSLLGNQVAWLISDDSAQLVDRSATTDLDELLAEAAALLRSRQQAAKRMSWQGDRWQLKQRWIEPNAPSGDPASGIGSASTASAHLLPHHYRALAITAGVPLAPMRASLRNLALVLAALSGGIWVTALFAGREVCRRALAPLTDMAQSIQRIDVADLAQRLPPLSSHDELAALNGSFNGLLNRLQESFERQERFTGDASHQLRTPLATILGQIEVALRRERPSEEYRQVLHTVQERAEHLRKIVESLLFLARADAEAALSEHWPIELNGWLALHLQSGSGHPRHGDLSLEAEGPAWINAQPVLLGELVNIFLDNAAKYSQPGQPIAVNVKLLDDKVELSIRDRGQGISPEDQARLFTPFFRSAEARRKGIDGLGLGLSIAKRLAATFGASLEITSQIGQGTLVALRFPKVNQLLYKDESGHEL